MIDAIVGLVGGISLIVAYILGRRGGQDKAESNQTKEALDNAQKANEVRDDVRRTDADARRDRLRNYSDE
ncbi:hypothetical protein PR08_gp36 [Idiomarinaceae phage Phi1M2-2]|uniref:hypothetical protein n=1 Tax=Idiomarinaceae phage Phi1M2-2 TaxID=1527515 RepID=UPI0004F7BC52|nr:hypothetical protein PR08_gp36 [Idiomarinaceae phage Phi1M2-2]AIM40793.1 putative membrane protein [Idiomarinaceae phage Phi1M2-2]